MKSLDTLDFEIGYYISADSSVSALVDNVTSHFPGCIRAVRVVSMFAFPKVSPYPYALR